MSWFEFFATVLPPLYWPIALVVVAKMFASDLPQFWPRLHKLGPAGVELYPHAKEQMGAIAEAEAKLSELKLEPLTDPVAIELETKLMFQADMISPDDLKPMLVRALTDAQMTRSFAMAYANIFGSQISALEKLNSQSLSREAANNLFLELKASDPAFWGDLTLDQYLKFLFNWKFITEEGEQLNITFTGRNFLQYLVFAGLSKDRLH